MNSMSTTAVVRTSSTGPSPPEYLSKTMSSRHPAFSARHPPNAQTRHRHDMLVQILADANGAGLNAIEINRRFGYQGTRLTMTALYKDLKQLTAQGRLQHEWLSRRGHLSSIYRLADDSRAAGSRLVCKACAVSVDLPEAEAFARVVAGICNTHGMPVSAQPPEIQVLCQSCEQLEARRST